VLDSSWCGARVARDGAQCAVVEHPPPPAPGGRPGQSSVHRAALRGRIIMMARATPEVGTTASDSQSRVRPEREHRASRTHARTPHSSPIASFTRSTLKMVKQLKQEANKKRPLAGCLRLPARHGTRAPLASSSTASASAVRADTASATSVSACSAPVRAHAPLGGGPEFYTDTDTLKGLRRFNS
jgi:hypothetical protein